MHHQFSRELRVGADVSAVAVQQQHEDGNATQIVNMSRRGMLCSGVNAAVGETLRFEFKHRGRTVLAMGKVRWNAASRCGVRIDEFLGHGETEWLQLMSSLLAKLTARDLLPSSTPTVPVAGALVIPSETRLPEALKLFVQARADMGWMPKDNQWAPLRFADLLPYWMELQELNALTDRQRLRHAITVLAHDLSTPIGIIRTTNSLLLSGIISPERFLKEGYAAMVDDNCQRVLDFTEDMINMSRNQLVEMRLERTECDLVDLVRDAEKVFQVSAQSRDIELSADIQCPAACAWVDRSKLQRALHNLVSNALKYSPRLARVSIKLSSADGYWRIDVEDTGVGISQQDLPHVFDQFTRVASEPAHGERSHGIGLSITKAIVEAHGGQLKVVSELGVGSTFTILLPPS